MVCVVVVAAVAAVALCRLVLRRARTALEWYMVCVVAGAAKGWWDSPWRIE